MQVEICIIRVGSTNRLADETLISELERRKRNISFDSEIIPDKPATELNIDSFKAIFKEKTGEEIIAECAVKDRIWGIDLSMKDENRFSTDKWRGQNLLGKILMQVREDIRHRNRVTQAFQNVEKAFSGAAEVAGFYTETELQDYVKKIRHEGEKE